MSINTDSGRLYFLSSSVGFVMMLPINSMGYELNYKKNSILQSDKQHFSTIYTYCYLLIFCTNMMILMHFLKLVSFSYLYAHY